jgi:hypothetical protein
LNWWANGPISPPSTWTVANWIALSSVRRGVQNHHDTAISTAAYLEFLREVDHPNCIAKV